ncbi:MAG: ATP-binding protein [Spirochaetales bacterium]
MKIATAGRKGLPLLVGLLLASLVLILWVTMMNREHDTLLSHVSSEAQYLADQTEADLRNRVPALQRLAQIPPGTTELAASDFLRDAQSYFSDSPGFQALEWVDRDSVIRLVVPLEGNEKAQGLNLSFEEIRRSALAAARASHEPTLTPPVELVQGGKGVLVFFPVYAGGSFQGSVLAVFRLEKWFDYVFATKRLRALKEDFQIQVLLENQSVYQTGDWTAPSPPAANLPEVSSQTQLLYHTLRIVVRPTPSYVESQLTALPALAALFGFLVSILVAFVVQLLLKTSAEVAERRRVEVELQSTVVRTELAAKAGRLGIWTWDLATDQMAWNDRMFELFGLNRTEQPTYEWWRQSIHPQDRGAAESLLLHSVAGEVTFDTEFRVVPTYGPQKILRAVATTVSDEQGTVTQVSGLQWDVTESRNAESELRRSAEQVKLLLDSTGEAIYGLDLDGLCTFANPACARMLGYKDPEMLIGCSMHELIHHHREDGQPLPLEECQIHRAILAGLPSHVENEVFWKADGSLLPAEYWSYPQLEHGKITGVVVTFIDVTERRAAEQARLEYEERLQKLNESLEERVQERTAELSEALEVVQLTKGSLVQQEKMASLGRLAAGIAHEINNPTGYILSNVRTLSEYFRYMQSLVTAGGVAVKASRTDRGPADPKAVSAAVRGWDQALASDDLAFVLKDTGLILSDAEKGAVRIRDIVKGLSSFAHADSGAPAPCNLNDVLKEALKVVNNKLKYHCRVETTLEPVPNLLAQAGKLEQVFINLLTNAADAIPDTGVITVRSWSDQHSVWVSVTDNGQGISEENQKRIFEPFFTTKDVGKGTGLGLSISVGIIEDHGGTIQVASKLGTGTTFTIRLPRHASTGS